MCAGEQCSWHHHDLRCDGARGCERDALPLHKHCKLLAHKTEHRAIREVEQGTTPCENHQRPTCQKGLEGSAVIPMTRRAYYEAPGEIGVNGVLWDRERGRDARQGRGS